MNTRRSIVRTSDATNSPTVGDCAGQGRSGGALQALVGLLLLATFRLVEILSRLNERYRRSAEFA